MAKQYLKEQAVSSITGLSLSTLRIDHSDPAKRQLPYVKIGRSVRYDLDDVVAFMESRKVVKAR